MDQDWGGGGGLTFEKYVKKTLFLGGSPAGNIWQENTGYWFTHVAKHGLI
jgi:hypothetical protein